MALPIALLLIPVLFSAIGYSPAFARMQPWLADQQVWFPPPIYVDVIMLTALGMFGGGVVVAGQSSDGILVVGLVAPLATALWLMVLVRRNRPRDAFMFLCVAWTLIAIVTAWAFALKPVSALLTLPLLVALILGGTANFFIWQRA